MIISLCFEICSFPLFSPPPTPLSIHPSGQPAPEARSTATPVASDSVSSRLGAELAAMKQAGPGEGRAKYAGVRVLEAPVGGYFFVATAEGAAAYGLSFRPMGGDLLKPSHPLLCLTPTLPCACRVLIAAMHCRASCKPSQMNPPNFYPPSYKTSPGV